MLHIFIYNHQYGACSGLASQYIFLPGRGAAVEWTALLLRNREILDSEFGPEAVYLEFSWFSSILTGKH
jgi:hypothetical protein